jgi:hypothetical protein
MDVHSFMRRDWKRERGLAAAAARQDSIDADVGSPCALPLHAVIVPLSLLCHVQLLSTASTVVQCTQAAARRDVLQFAPDSRSAAARDAAIIQALGQRLHEQHVSLKKFFECVSASMSSDVFFFYT